ncbi:MAG: hypothetical protein SPD47_11825 [Oscillospiraceae bacterium]|nr:hypothetical protein [Oscillospiraceae bacterium]
MSKKYGIDRENVGEGLALRENGIRIREGLALRENGIRIREGQAPPVR